MGSVTLRFYCTNKILLHGFVWEQGMLFFFLGFELIFANVRVCVCVCVCVWLL